MLDLNEYIKITTGILVIVNPLGAVPVFVSLTSTQSARERSRTAWITAASAGLVLLLAALSGESILHFFGIGIPAFQVGGGVLILLMAIDMFHARRNSSKHTPEEAEEAEDKDSVAVVPLGIPLLAGPGSMSTVILYAHQSSDWLHMLFLCIIIIFVAIVVWVVLRLAVPVRAVLGTTGINIAIRLMGLILAAIAIEFVAGGLLQLFPGLAITGRV